ncbi:MAG: flagellar basal body rod protein FlgB [Schwartzia sp.]|nr:flagellar basal body rod protein FlgB [Schwartzia sp. (in: firmicutes)]
MLDQIMRSPTFDYLERGLSAANLRHEVISDNLANVNTPNFKRSEVVFEEVLAKELYGDDDKGKLQLVRTHDRHLPFKKFERAAAYVERDDTMTMRVDNNNVDIDMEMASLAKNQLWYNAMTRMLGGHISKIKSVMQGGES